MAPTQVSQFNSSIVSFDAQGVIGTCPAGGTLNLDYVLQDDHEITGGTLLTKGSAFGDSANVLVLDPNNLMGLGAGAVLNQFVTNYYMSDTTSKEADFDLPYPAKIVAGLVLRCTYKSIGVMPVQVAFNYRLHINKV
jgi:hypothetical protein